MNKKLPPIHWRYFATLLLLIGFGLPAVSLAQAVKKPNIILIVSDDFGYGDAGVYGGGPNRSHRKRSG